MVGWRGEGGGGGEGVKKWSVGDNVSWENVTRCDLGMQIEPCMIVYVLMIPDDLIYRGATLACMYCIVSKLNGNIIIVRNWLQCLSSPCHSTSCIWRETHFDLCLHGATHEQLAPRSVDLLGTLCFQKEGEIHDWSRRIQGELSSLLCIIAGAGSVLWSQGFPC